MRKLLLFILLLLSCSPKPGYLDRVQIKKGLYRGYFGKIVGEEYDHIGGYGKYCFKVKLEYPEETHNVPKDWVRPVDKFSPPSVIRDTVKIQIHDTIVDYSCDCEADCGAVEEEEEDWLNN